MTVINKDYEHYKTMFSSGKEYREHLGKKFKELTQNEYKIYKYLNSVAYLNKPGVQEHCNEAYRKRYQKLSDEKKQEMYSYLKTYFENKKAHFHTSFKRRVSNAPLEYKLQNWIFKSSKRVGKRTSNWLEVTGLTIDEFKSHIESQFVEGMSWDNWSYYGWHIDHIIPVVEGGNNHYTNLQPLWAKDNLAKGKKIFSEKRL